MFGIKLTRGRRNTWIAIFVVLAILAALSWLVPARADVIVPLGSCVKWSVNDNVFVCTQGATLPITPPIVVTPPTAPTGCAGYQRLSMPLGWPKSGTSTPRALSANVGQFGNGTVLVVPFHTGPKPGIGRVSVSEFSSGPTMRTASLSAVPCAFGPQALSTRYGNGVTLYFSVGPNTYQYPALEANHDYFFNVKNEDASGQPSCISGSCDVGLDLLAP